MKKFFKSRTIQGAIITTIGLITAAIIGTPYNSGLADIFLTEKNDSIRKLQPLETGKYIGDLPDGIYGYESIDRIEYEIETAKPHWKWLKLSNKKDSDNVDYELQKRDGIYYLIGFVGSNTFSRMGSANKDNPLSVTLSPYEWDSEINAIEVPLDAINKIDIRPINVTEKEILYVLDMEVTKINSALSVHKK